MRRLSGQGAGFLYADTTHSNANVSLLHIHDQSTADGGVVRFKTLLAHIERRLDRAPLFRQRLQPVPLGLDHPYWVDDERFDLEYHVRHIALPKPGDWRQFCIQVSRIHARALDLDRPLWELYVIEGLDSLLDLPVGSFALVLKTHLAAVDPTRLGELSALLYDPSPRPPREGPAEPWLARPVPGKLGLLRRTLLHSLAAPSHLAAPLMRVAARAAPAAVTLAGEAVLRPSDLPMTRFNSVVSPHRVFETRRFTDAEFEAVRALVRSATLDDAVMAVCGGALRRYLAAEDELPTDHSLVAIVPAPMPAADDSPGWRHVSLGTEIADPLERLKAIRAQSRARTRSPAPGVCARAGHRVAAIALAWTRRTVSRAGAQIGRRAPPANCSISTIAHPGDTGAALYLCGAKLTYFSAILPIADGLGLAFALTRCDGRIVISPTSCRELMPDPEFFAQCLRESFQDYLALARFDQVAQAPASGVLRSAPHRGSPTRRARPASRSAGTASNRPRAGRVARR